MPWTPRESLLTSAGAYLSAPRKPGTPTQPSPLTIAGIILLGCVEDQEIAHAVMTQLMDPAVRELVRRYIHHVALSDASEEMARAESAIDVVQTRLRLVKK